MVYFSSSGSVVITIVISACHQYIATHHPPTDNSIIRSDTLMKKDKVGATGIRNLEDQKSGTSIWRIVKINFVKLREREGQGVEPGRSLKGHL